MTGSPESTSGQPYADPVWGPPDSGDTDGKSKNGIGVASLVVGVVALLVSLTVVGGLVLGMLAVILGVIARAQFRHGQASNGDVAMTGIVLGVLAIIATIIIAMFWTVPAMTIINAAIAAR